MAVIEIRDSHSIKDAIGNNKTIAQRIHGGPSKTKIIITDHETGEVLGVLSNKILVPGSQNTACAQFGLEPIIKFPTYNTELDLDHSYEEWTEEPKNKPITCLWCVGRDGSGSSPNEVFTVVNTDRVEPVDDIIPFRYLSAGQDLDDDQREIYFGKFSNGSTGKMSYFFKAFDTTPQLHINYLDGTEVTSDMWSIETDQPVEIYVEMKLSINRLDFREYFDQVLGWDKADISTISLLTAWYDEFKDNPDVDKKYRYYQDVIPFSKFNFKAEELIDLTRALDFNYQVFY